MTSVDAQATSSGTGVNVVPSTLTGVSDTATLSAEIKAIDVVSLAGLGDPTNDTPQLAEGATLTEVADLQATSCGPATCRRSTAMAARSMARAGVTGSPLPRGRRRSRS